MQDKFNLSLTENIFLAKKLIIQAIYDGAKLEGCNITFPQTETILNGYSVAGLKMDDVQVVLNLRDAWNYVFKTIDEPISLEYWNKINGFVAHSESLEWGVLRYGQVGISGTSYIPPIPDEKDVRDKITQIIFHNTNAKTERAIDLFLYGCRSQNYWDGNKRTSLVITNKFLIQNGNGILTIPEDKLVEFGKLLTGFYESGIKTEVKQFLYAYAIRGMTIIPPAVGNLKS